jgi:plastin-1
MHDLRDGRILLKVLDNYKHGTVDWNKRYSNKLTSRIHIVQNCNYVVEICKGLGAKIIGIDGVDIVDGKVTLTLGLVWQICKMYWEERVGKINDEQLTAWGNSKVPS